MDSSAPRILIIDNDTGRTRALARPLREAGYTCLTACTGDQALELLSDSSVDAVLLDVNMPGAETVALARAMRSITTAPMVFVREPHGPAGERLATVPQVVILAEPETAADVLARVGRAVGADAA